MMSGFAGRHSWSQSPILIRMGCYPCNSIVCEWVLNCGRLFVTPRTTAHQAPLSGDLPNPGIKFMSLASPSLTGKVFTTVPPGQV